MTTKFLVALIFVSLSSAAATPANDAREQAVRIVAQIQRADYEDDRAAMQRGYDQLTPFIDDQKLASRIRYWRGFAQWKRAINETLARQREAMHPRLFPEIPKARYVSFYPMDRRRGEDKNWYTLPIEERARQMNEHGLVGRRYAGEVKQIITGSIGFDDWEWGVDLFADDPLVFKKLIYEMRFDEVSAVYAQFGHFYVGVRCSWCSLGKLLNGEVPE